MIGAARGKLRGRQDVGGDWRRSPGHVAGVPTGGGDNIPLMESGMNGSSSGPVCRTGSCVEDPQKSAMDALKSGDSRLLSDLLEDLDVDSEYQAHGFKTLLQVAVEQDNLSDVEILLRGGADPLHANSYLRNTCLHVAAARAKPSVLKLLLEACKQSGKTDFINVQDRGGNTPLHHAVMAGKLHPADALQCVRLCVAEAGVDLNMTSKAGGQTPLYLAAAGKNFACVKYLIEAGADSSIPCKGNSTRQLIKDNFAADQVAMLDLEGSVRPSPDNKGDFRKKITQMIDIAELDGQDPIKFDRIIAGIRPTDIDGPNGAGGKSFVQMCGERGLDLYLASLLRHGVGPNQTCAAHSASALLLAAENGHENVLKVLTQHNLTEMKESRHVDFCHVDNLGQTVLHAVMRKPLFRLDASLSAEETEEDSEDVYSLCLDVLLKNVSQKTLQKIINKQDNNGNTALHYGVQFWSQEIVMKLLVLGANIGLRNKLGESPISSILPETMEDFLNRHCIQSQGNPTNDNFKITFKYDFLAPPHESLPIELQGETSDDRMEKQDKNGGNIQPETDVLWKMSRSKAHRHLLKHPVITSFLSLKWSRISSHYNSNLIFYTTFVICLTSHIFNTYSGTALGVLRPNCTNDTGDGFDPPGGGYSTGNIVLWWMVAILVSILAVREVFQLGIAASRYFRSPENILEIGLIVVCWFLLLYGTPGCDLETKRELAAAAIVISWVELVTMIGRHPLLTTYNTYLTMFYRVLNSFFLFLTWYSMFILAFALAFYILLHDDTGKDAESEYPYFDYVGLSLVKTFSMFVGELEFSDLPLSSSFSYIFFLLFLFLIVVVLMNLLNGLAVSDTGVIREEAEIHSHVCRVEVISSAEATILGDPGHILTGPVAWIPTCGFRRRLGRILRIREIFQRMSRGRGVLLFYNVLKDKQLSVYPNRRSQLCSPCLSSKDLGPEILDSAKQLVVSLAKEDKHREKLENSINAIRLKQKSLEDKLDSVLDKLENLSNSLKL